MVGTPNVPASYLLLVITHGQSNKSNV